MEIAVKRAGSAVGATPPPTRPYSWVSWLLPAWLEGHLVGPDLAELVAELAVFHGASPGPGPSVREVLGPQLAPVLLGGLGKLPPSALKQLLRRRTTNLGGLSPFPGRCYNGGQEVRPGAPQGSNNFRPWCRGWFPEGGGAG
jgi:hypothetical protein